MPWSYRPIRRCEPARNGGLGVCMPSMAHTPGGRQYTPGGIASGCLPADPEEHFMELDPSDMTPVINRLKRAQGQLGAVARMLEEGADCKDVVTQLSAVSKALDRAGFAIIASGMEQCLGDPERDLDRKQLEKLFLTLA